MNNYWEIDEKLKAFDYISYIYTIPSLILNFDKIWWDTEQENIKNYIDREAYLKLPFFMTPCQIKNHDFKTVYKVYAEDSKSVSVEFRIELHQKYGVVIGDMLEDCREKDR